MQPEPRERIGDHERKLPCGLIGHDDSPSTAAGTRRTESPLVYQSDQLLSGVRTNGSLAYVPRRRGSLLQCYQLAARDLITIIRMQVAEVLSCNGWCRTADTLAVACYRTQILRHATASACFNDMICVGLAVFGMYSAYASKFAA